MKQRDVVIVGAGPAGLAAAMYTQPDGWNTLVFESRWVGGQGAIAYTVRNYPGFLAGDGAVLMDNMEKQVTASSPASFGVELRRERVSSINGDKMTVKTEVDEYQAKAIILATGSKMQRLGVPGEDRLFGKGVSYYAKLDVKRFAGKKVMVVGGGNTTAKSALLAKSEGQAGEVTLVHRRESLRTYASMLKLLQNQGVNISFNTEVKEIKGGDTVNSVITLNNKANTQAEVDVDWIVVCVGTEPDVDLAKKAGITVVGHFIKVDARMMTNRTGIFACGEIVGSHCHLVNAAADGASAGMAASEYLAMDLVRNGRMFEGAKNGKYADEYLQMIKQG
jgi:thioredoxin reductase (NADPH)